MIPSLREAATDPALTPRDVRTLLILSDELDLVEYRPLKLAVLRRMLGVSRVTAWTAIGHLIGRGYIERGVKVPGQPRTYRLKYRVQKPEPSQVV